MLVQPFESGDEFDFMVAEQMKGFHQLGLNKRKFVIRAGLNKRIKTRHVNRL